MQHEQTFGRHFFMVTHAKGLVGVRRTGQDRSILIILFFWCQGVYAFNLQACIDKKYNLAFRTSVPAAISYLAIKESPWMPVATVISSDMFKMCLL